MVRLTSTLLGLAGLAALTAAAPIDLESRATCASGFYIIAARGSNEAAGEGKVGQVASAVAAQVPGSYSVAVDYPATLTSYPSSVSSGITAAKQLVQDYVDTCGDSSRIILLGYSQGGNVMTDLLAGGVDKPDPLDSYYAQYITGVAVFGDPSFTAGQSFDRGTATKSGIFAREVGGSSLALLNTYADILHSYCDEHDFFCASGDSLDVHYAEVPTNAADATSFLVSLA